MKILNYIFGAAFLLSALVQLNDPDPWLWTSFYFLACLLCVQFARDKLAWQIPTIVAAVAFCGCLWLLPQFLGQVDTSEIFESVTMRTRAVEEAREAGGALLVAVWMAVLGWALRKKPQIAAKD